MDDKGYILTDKESKWVDIIVRKTSEGMNPRQFKKYKIVMYQTAIDSVTFFTRKLNDVVHAKGEEK